MKFAVTAITKIIMFIMNISRFFKGKLGDETETEIMNTVEEAILGIFGVSYL